MATKTTEEQLHDFDPTAGFEIDQETVETPDRLGPLYPVLQWNYADAKQAQKGIKDMDGLGGWFYSTDVDEAESDEQKERKARVSAAMADHGWQETTWIHDNGQSTTGCWKREIAVSVIALRKCWQVFGGERVQSFAWTDFETAKQAGRPSSRTHVLCLVKGLEEHGPFVLTLKGSAAMAFEGTRKVPGALQEFSRTIIAKANAQSAEAAKKANKPAPKWPFRCFWLPVGADRDVKGQPVFTEVGSGNATSRVVLPIALGLAKDADLRRFYVGPELQAKTQDLYIENEEWRQAWDTMEPGGNGSGSGEEKAAEKPSAAAAVQENGNVLEELGL